jgi:tRNA A37 threonylcarbamoyltransferase TsaD
MGLTIDIPLGNLIDTVAEFILQREDILSDTKQISEFVQKHNQEHPTNLIPDRFFDGVAKWPSNGKSLEKLAKFGDLKEYELPIAFKIDELANVSFTGLQTTVRFKIFESIKGSRKNNDQIYHFNPNNLTFSQLLNLAASTQFAAFFQVQRKLKTILDYTKRNEIPIKSVQLVGGCACN